MALAPGSCRTVAMSTINDAVNNLMKDLEQQRDELEVQLALAKAEARDEWEELEKRWEKVKSQLGQAGDTAAEVADDVGEAAKLLLDEIGRGYERIRKLL